MHPFNTMSIQLIPNGLCFKLLDYEILNNTLVNARNHLINGIIYTK